LGDVLAELGSAKRHRVDRAEGRFALVDEVRDAFREEAVDICEQASATMDFAAEQGRGAAADVIAVRHRFARGRVEATLAFADTIRIIMVACALTILTLLLARAPKQQAARGGH
jgi:hypothetical protein